MEAFMNSVRFERWSAAGILAIIASVFLWPATASAQTVSGQAAAVQATVFGLSGNTVIGLANTGTLGSATDAREASQLTGNLLGALTAEVPQATTIGLGDQVASQASLANLALSIAGSSIGADFLIAEATAAANGARSGSTNLTNLSLNGVPVAVTGAPNQSVAIPGGTMVINEQQSSPAGMVVNALHVLVTGVADVLVGSATAGIQ
jgi:hypothetical protein